jgi:hypothetical protein
MQRPHSGRQQARLALPKGAPDPAYRWPVCPAGVAMSAAMQRSRGAIAAVRRTRSAATPNRGEEVLIERHWQLVAAKWLR